MATRGSRRILLSFWRPRAVFTRTRSPSRSTHTGVTCGLPSGMSVARLANARFVKRSRYLSGIDCDKSSSLLELHEQHYRRCPADARATQGTWLSARYFTELTAASTTLSMTSVTRLG